MHKSTFIENIRNVSRQVSGECDGFHGSFFFNSIFITFIILTITDNILKILFT